MRIIFYIYDISFEELWDRTFSSYINAEAELFKFLNYKQSVISKRNRNEFLIVTKIEEK